MSGPDDRRLEELSLNSSASPAQLLYDGWIVRLAPGKAKRARSVNAFYPSALPLDEKIGYCQSLYRGAGLPLLFRITPFCQPAGLDRELEGRGYARFEATSVQGAALEPGCAASPNWEAEPLPGWIEAVAALRGSPTGQAAAHRARLEGLPLPMRPLAVREAGEVVATGLVVVEGDCAGLFDIVTHPSARRRGHARRLVAALLRSAWELGARHAYLQVEGGNAAALELYRGYGFRERYQYWYRGREGT